MGRIKTVIINRVMMDRRQIIILLILTYFNFTIVGLHLFMK